MELKRGDYVGEFNLGSSIVLVFEAPEGFSFGPMAAPGDRILVGRALTNTTAAANKTNGWLPTAPTGAYTYVCRGSEAALYPCPPSPPAANPPPPLISSSLCEYRRSAGRGHARLLP